MSHNTTNNEAKDRCTKIGLSIEALEVLPVCPTSIAAVELSIPRPRLPFPLQRVFESKARGTTFTTVDKNGELVKAYIAIFSFEKPSLVKNKVVFNWSITTLPFLSIRR